MATPIPDNVARFTAAELALASGGVLVRGAPDEQVEGIVTDSRRIRAGCLFVALRGESFDGHRFVGGAIAAGASAVLVEHGAEVPEGPTPRPGRVTAVIAVDDTLVALGAIARCHRTRWARARGGDAVVIGVTGSAGKTTTKELCAAMIASALGDDAVHATRGNLNNRVGVPLTLLGLEPRHRVAVIEMGTSVRGEIAALVSIARPEVGLLVSVGLAHAEGLAGAPRAPHEPSWVGRAAGREAVAREKSAILAGASSFAIANHDDPWARASLVLAAEGADAFGFGASDGARVRLVDVEHDAQFRPRLVVERPAAAGASERVTFAVPLLGDVAVLDAAGALAAADAALELLSEGRIDGRALEEGLAKRIRAVPGRLAPRRRRDGAIVLDDTYNASPDAFRAALELARVLADRAARRLVVVAGEMRELGPVAVAAHEELARQVIDARPALLATCGGHADRIADAAIDARIEVLRAGSAKEAAERIAERIEANDLVLVKASRGVTAELCVDAILARGGEIEDAPGSDPGNEGR